MISLLRIKENSGYSVFCDFSTASLLQFKHMTLVLIREDTCLLGSSPTSGSMYNLRIHIHFHRNISGLL